MPGQPRNLWTMTGKNGKVYNAVDVDEVVSVFHEPGSMKVQMIFRNNPAAVTKHFPTIQDAETCIRLVVEQMRKGDDG